MMHKWNRCDDCGQFISYDDLFSGRALRSLITPDSEISVEDYETLCAKHAEQYRREFYKPID